MNKRIVKATRNNLGFKAAWLMSQRWVRMTGIEREIGYESQSSLLQQWLQSRKGRV